MKYDYIGKSDLKASRVVLGCMRMAGLDVEKVKDVIKTAIDNGINTFDHADIYGKGESEEIFAKAFKELGLKREDYIIQSKCGIRPGYYDFSYEYIIESVDGILKRLDTDYLDILILHRPDTLMDMDDVSRAINELIDSGKIRYYGLSNMNVGQIKLIESWVGKEAIVDQVQFSPAHTGLIDSGIKVNMYENDNYVDTGLLEYARLRGLTLQAWSPFQVDLSQGPINEHKDYKSAVKEIEEVGKRYDLTYEGIVTAWILRHPAKIFMVAGSMTPTRIENICKASDVEISRQDWYEIYRANGNMIP